MLAPTLDQIAMRFGLVGDMRLESLARAAGKLRMELAAAEREQIARIRQLLRERGFIATGLGNLKPPERTSSFPGEGGWKEDENGTRLPRTAHFLINGEERWPLALAYFCPNGCEWVAQEYPPAPFQGWGRRTLDASLSRPCVVCALPVPRTPDISYAASAEMPTPVIPR